MINFKQYDVFTCDKHHLMYFILPHPTEDKLWMRVWLTGANSKDRISTLTNRHLRRDCYRGNLSKIFKEIGDQLGAIGVQDKDWSI